MSNLTAQTVLGGLADALRDKIMPALADDDFANEQARLCWVLLTLMSKQVDGLAAIRIADNEAMRALFGDAAQIVGGDLATELTGAARGREPGYTISALDAENGRLRSLLVELHAALEIIQGAHALAMHQRIWRLLQEMEERRG